LHIKGDDYVGKFWLDDKFCILREMSEKKELKKRMRRKRKRH